MIALLLDEEELNPEKKRVWVHNALVKGKIEGEYWILYKELENYETKFIQYFRLSKFRFSYLLQKIHEI